MRCVEPCVSEAEAVRLFERRRFGNLWGLLGQGRRTSAGGRPFIELIWLPHYLIEFAVTSRRGPGTITVSVEAHSGAFAVIELARGLVERPDEQNTFPPKLDEEEAVVMGRKDLLQSIMRRRGQRHRPVIEKAVGVDLFHYPYWVYYYERRRGLLDVKVLDAVTRESGRPRTRAGVLSALVKAGEPRSPPVENRA